MSWARATRIEGKPIFDWLRTPGMTMESLAARMGGTASIAGEVARTDTASPAGEAVAPGLVPSPGIARLVEIRARYDGYLQRQDRQLEEFARLETKLIPPGLDYATVSGLRREARETLIQFTPRSLGQALRLSGVTPADVTLLAVHLSRHGAR